MTFFNKKEQVFDIQLTQYGKHLLSKGKFNPEFYAFYDDDIVYDIDYMTPSNNASLRTEKQNGSQKRIKNAARPTLQYNLGLIGAETNHKSMEARDERMALATPLGNSSLATSSAPCWNVKFLLGKMSGSSNAYESSGSQVQNIPQINAEITYEYDIQKKSGIINEEIILLEIDEKNSRYSKDNFLIEIFEVTHVSESSPSGYSRAREVLRPLKYGLNTPTKLKEEQIEIDEEDAEFFVSLSFDDQIPKSTLCPALYNDSVNNGSISWLDNILCKDYQATVESPEDIYEFDDPGEEC